jgi:hypothetical protein
MTQIIDHVISTLARETKERLQKIAEGGGMISFLLAEALPENWEEEEEPERRILDGPATPADAEYRANLIDEAAEKWETQDPATQKAIATAVLKLDPRVDVEDLELLGQIRVNSHRMNRTTDSVQGN